MANEADPRVVADIVRADIGADEQVGMAAEIDAIAWISVNAPPHIPMAPLTEYLILPPYRQLVSAGKA